MTLEQRKMDTDETETQDSTELGITDLNEEVLMKLGVNTVSIGASADAKVNIAQYESAGIFASLNITYDVSGLTGTMPLNDIVNKVLIPLRNSTTKLVHAETMSRAEELRAIIEGTRDGKSYAQIEDQVQNTRRSFMSMFRKVFEPKKH